ncbi:MAG: MFS transporter [Thermomicrobiales bacterium]
MSEPEDSTRRGPLVIAMAAVFLGAVDLTVIATVLPAMVLDLGVNTADVDRYVWVVNAYLLAYVVAIPIVGRLSDILGRRIVFEAALFVFAAGSIWCALASDLSSLIAARTLQGIGGGALLPVTMALVGDLLPPGRRLTAIGLVGAVDTLGWVFGPIWGALIVNLLIDQPEPWRWIFWINLPLCLFVAAAIRKSFPRSTPTEGRGTSAWRRLDILGVILLASAMALFNLGLSAGGELGIAAGSGLRAFGGTHNPLADYVVPLVVAGLVFFLAFVLWQRRSQDPLVPMRLFEHRIIASALVGNVLIGAALIVTMVDIPVVIALLVDPDRISVVSATILAPFTVAMAVLSLTGARVARRYSVRTGALSALVLVGVGYGLLWLGLRNEDYVRMVPGLVIAGMGFGLVVAPLGASVIDASPAEDRGATASLTIVARLLGMTVGMSALTGFGVRRLQTLTERAEPIVRGPEESTAEFLVRQSAFIESVAIPLSIQVVRETFLIAAAIALVAAIPLWMMTTPHHSRAERQGNKR